MDNFRAINLDSSTISFYLKVARAKIVMFQAIFESYEGIGTVRTIDIERFLVSIITTHSQEPDCQRLLLSIKPYFGLACAADEYLINREKLQEKGSV